MTKADPLDDRTTGLMALAWTLDDPARASRLLALTGLDPAGLRAGANDPAVLAAVIGFLQAHQPDLIACADHLAIRPEALVAAGERMSA